MKTCVVGFRTVAAGGLSFVLQAYLGDFSFLLFLFDSRGNEDIER